MMTLRRSTPLLAVVVLSSVTLAQSPNLVTNGTFATGTTAGWSLFASSPGTMESRVRNGVFEWNRTGDASTQASIFQNTGAAMTVPVVASFDIGNSANVRQRMSVVLFDADFSDLSVCVFWLDPGAPMRTYRMRSHPTQRWANASIAFYAGTTASFATSGGFLRLDNVSFAANTSGSDTRTDCVDPTSPPPPGGAESASLVLNGTFNLGMSFWQIHGKITSVNAGGVFYFIRNPGLPAAVIYQTTGASVAANEFLTARVDLGNSSPVRKRVTVVVHANDFSDLAACTFWLPPGQPRLPYVMRMRATRAWGPSPLTTATLSVYGATVGAEVWIELDNLSLTRSPGAAVQGTECVEPELAFAASSTVEATSPAAATRPAAETSGRASRPSAARPAGPGSIDVSGTPRALAGGTSWVADVSAPIDVQASLDGEQWLTVARVAPGTDWADVDVDLSAFQGEPVRVRLIYVSPAVQAAGWRVIRLRIVQPPAPG